MRKSKISNTQRLEILAKWDSGASIDELCRTYQISAATLYNWRKAKAEDEDETRRRLKELESENARLKKMYAELSIDHGILKDGYEMLKKWQAQDARKK
ncbi:MAG: transposase [Saprospiraceae bacterium]|jgi:putative transposase